MQEGVVKPSWTLRPGSPSLPRRMDDDAADRGDVPAADGGDEVAVGLDREVTRQEGAGCAGDSLVVEMHVRVAGPLGDTDLHLRLPFFGAAGLGMSSAVQNTPPW